jgi:hypothetical protein
MRRADGERGQVVPLVAAILTVAGLCVVGLGRLGAEASGRASAQSLADVVALAGATGGVEAAGAVVAANGGELVGFEESDPFVQVEVRRGGHQARATAERVPDEPEEVEEVEEVGEVGAAAGPSSTGAAVTPRVTS